MASVACRRCSFIPCTWTELPLKPASTMAEAVHNQAARELMRNAPEVFTNGALEGMAPIIQSWEELYTGTEVAIIKEGLNMRTFNDLLAVMVELFPPSEGANEKATMLHRKKVVFQTIRLWDQVCELKGE